jgi:hypothetical protein
MNVKNILLKDMVLQANQGLDMTEGSDISLSNVQFITKNSNPVLNIHNSKNILLNGIKYNADADMFLNVSGEKSNGIIITKTNTAKNKIQFTYGGNEKAVEVR